MLLYLEEQDGKPAREAYFYLLKRCEHLDQEAEDGAAELVVDLAQRIRVAAAQALGQATVVAAWAGGHDPLHPDKRFGYRVKPVAWAFA